MKKISKDILVNVALKLAIWLPIVFIWMRKMDALSTDVKQMTNDLWQSHKK